jgi:CheY-like chemotaxis protein/predicted regulator of Ras-like GTPase activity (Roadblock/LC7/MglB family)
MAQRILVVDGNAAFATMLRQLLETEGGYQVRVSSRGSDALAMLDRDRFDLTIVDMDLDPEDLGYRDLIRRVRRKVPGMRLVLIPLMGQALPVEAQQLDLQGSLSKPFFADDLLPCIKAALSAPVAAAPEAPAPRAVPPPPGSRRAVAATGRPHVQELLLDLARETGADLVAVLSLEGEGRAIAQVGSPGKAAAGPLAGLSAGALQAGQQLARFLGQPDQPFEHNLFESESFRLYILSLPGDLALLLAAPLGAPLGAVRHNLRRVGRELANMPLT